MRVTAAGKAFGIANSSANAAFACPMGLGKQASMAAPAPANNVSMRWWLARNRNAPWFPSPTRQCRTFWRLASPSITCQIRQSCPTQHPVDTLKDGLELGSLLVTKAPASWEAHCHPDFLMHVQGTDGSTCVYATFSIPGFPQEQRFIRHISDRIAEKNFAKDEGEAQGHPTVE